MCYVATDPPQGTMPPTRARTVAARLRELIQSGEIGPGTHLRQAEVARRFGVSTTPVREAFVALAREGLVRQDAHRGVVVFMPSVAEVVEMYEIRAALESLAAEHAATRLSADVISEISTIVERMRDAEPRDYVDLNRQLHCLIYAAAGRPRLIELIAELRDAAANYISLTIRRYDSGYRAQVQAEHEEIVAALRSAAPERAAHAVRVHLEHNARHVAGLVETGTAPT
jgi:DNA-binding GntR family transcriptional regulator